MSLVNDIDDHQAESLAVLYCDAGRTPFGQSGMGNIRVPEGWRPSPYRAARELAERFGGKEVRTAEGGWAATFGSTVEALMCARALADTCGDSSQPALSGGLSAGEVTRASFGITGRPVWEAISLCRQASPGQVLVADPLRVVAPDSERALRPPRPLGMGDTPAATLTGGATAPSAPPSSRAAVAGAALGMTGFEPLGAQRWSPHFEIIVGQGGEQQGAAEEVEEPAEQPLRLLSSPPISALSHRTRLTVLGWVQLEEGEPSRCLSAVRGRQARAVVTMLALRQNPVHKEELAELLWPSAMPEHWEGAIRGVITKVRRFLDGGGVSEPDALTAEGGYYELRLPATVVVDRHLATDLISAATLALATGNAGEASALARRAVTILRRRLLSGPDHGWFDQIRSELDRERLAALELSARAELRVGSFEAAKRAATEALAMDSYRESSYRLLMETHATAGSRGEALRTYERCRRVLADELGVNPSPQTQALYLHLLG